MTLKKKPSKQSPKAKKSTKPESWKLALAILISGALTLTGILIFFGLKLEPVAPPIVPVERTAISTYSDVSRLVEDELLNSDDSAGWRRLAGPESPARLQMYGDYPESLRLMELATRIALTDSPAQLDLAPRKGLVRVYWHGELRMELRYHVSEILQNQRPKIAIIMDDMGRSLDLFKQVLKLKLTITPAILPETRFATGGAHYLQDQGHEYMIHLPMEPKNYPAVSPGPNALLVKLRGDELTKRVQSYLAKVPGAVGGNNHMGSRFTEDRDAMHQVLESLQSAGLFFIDSRTIGDSVAFDEARKMGVRTAQRQIFLDNQEDSQYVTQQLRKMVKIAEEKGAAIAICHPHQQTFTALKANQQWLLEQNVDFVLASRLVKEY